MKINLERYLKQELNLIANLFLNNDEWKRIDLFAFEKKINNKNIVLVIYPKLLQYDYRYRLVNKDVTISENFATPWIACRIELEGNNTDEHQNILELLKDWIDSNMPMKPFHDEDATLGMFGKGCSPYSRDWTEYIFYLNPDYPDGWWENHTL